MLDFGLPELFLIIAIAVLVIGPDQVPGLMYKFGKFLNRLRGLRFALSKQFDDFMDEVELREDAKKASATPQETDEASHDEDEAYITPKPDVIEDDGDEKYQENADLFDQEHTGKQADKIDRQSKKASS